MKLVLIPLWMEEAFAERGLPPEAILDTNLLQSTLSVEDVTFYIHLNQSFNRFLPQEVVAGFDSGSASALGFTPEVLDSFQDGLLAYGTASEVPFRSQWFFGPQSESVELEKIRYQIRPALEDTLILCPRIVESQTKVSLISMVDDLLFYLNGRLAFPDLAKTTVFRYYLTHVQHV